MWGFMVYDVPVRLLVCTPIDSLKSGAVRTLLETQQLAKDAVMDSSIPKLKPLTQGGLLRRS
jgi:hypothetical protein